jgi:hypothetical protein
MYMVIDFSLTLTLTFYVFYPISRSRRDAGYVSAAGSSAAKCIVDLWMM